MLRRPKALVQGGKLHPVLQQSNIVEKPLTLTPKNIGTTVPLFANKTVGDPSGCSTTEDA